ncbi:Gfo/Idh/MocA family oxidoreductase, partial [Burkholderia sp. Ac-20379]|uniref:Gfo/Idh/MocA family oxidoreductase n=1 Tax=Burkholderia sp. Ac-20379 TaxID=2703900 RepID=UPI00197CC621
YLNGLAAAPEHFELVGILARGSAFARGCAQARGVPLYTDVAALPDAIDAACVVVRSGVVGGAGARISAALLERGIHVIQEQPVHHDELADLLRRARQAGVCYRLNGFYPHVAGVARFIAASRHVLTRCRPLFVDAACSVHVMYPLIDILGQALGQLRPWSFAMQAAADGAQGPFSSVSGRIGGVPLTLRVQNEFDPADPDNHIHLFHQISLGTDGGTLMLTGSHGQLLWQPRMRLQRRGDGVLDLSARHPALDAPVASILGPAAAPSFHDTFERVWGDAARDALLGFHAAIVAGRPDSARQQATLSAARAWGELAAELGAPRSIAPPDSAPLSADEIATHLDEALSR